ncbi:hypothetical protein PGB90_009425 [Kerria lacca]
MGAKVSRNEFEWTYTEEPHATRRKEILKKYPEIKKLYGIDPNFKWTVLTLVILQLLSLFVIQYLSWPTLLITAYCFGGVINHTLMLAVHEIAHSMAFGPSRPLHNKLFGILANLPIPFPFAITFKYYHLEHHRYQGDEVRDTDIPTYLEARLFCTTFGKFIWVCLQPLFYSLRPMFIYPKMLNKMEFFNIVTQMTFDFFLYKYFGIKIIAYLTLGSVFAMGLHPVAGHFISEHYMFRKGFETYSYYGILNYITFNVGYHNEHHDFPFIPGSRLPMVRKIAPEFYNDLPHHDSWCSVIYDFIMDPDIGPYARVKRKRITLATQGL